VEVSTSLAGALSIMEETEICEVVDPCGILMAGTDVGEGLTPS
jgi:hypothetical protein